MNGFTHNISLAIEIDLYPYRLPGQVGRELFEQSFRSYFYHSGLYREFFKIPRVIETKYLPMKDAGKAGNK